jgi:hypothetical protein
MAKSGVSSTGKECRDVPAALGGHRRKRQDTTKKDVELPAGDPVVDLVIAQADRAQLPAVKNGVLARGKPPQTFHVTFTGHRTDNVTRRSVRPRTVRKSAQGSRQFARAVVEVSALRTPAGASR